MKFFDYIRLALKNIWRQKLRTILTIFAVVIGATSVVAMLSLVFGAKHAILSQIEATGALTQINVIGSTDTANKDLFGGGSDHSGTKLDDTIAAKLAVMGHVVSVTPQVSAYSFSTISLKGGDGKAYTFNQVTAYKPSATDDHKLSAGRNLTATDKEGKIVIASSIADKLGFKDAAGIVGKTVMLNMQRGYQGEGADIPKPLDQSFFNGPMTKAQQEAQRKQQDDYQQQVKNLETSLEAEVVGVTESGFADASYINLEWARGIMKYQNWQQDQADMERYQHEMDQLNRNQPPGTPIQKPATPVKWVLSGQDQIEQNGYDTIVVKVDDANNVEALAADITSSLKLGAITAKDTLDTILKTFNIIALVLGIVGAISLFVAAIGVVNTMVMATLERTREIGVMRACGATRAAVRRLFTFEAALLGFWGGVLGVLAGFGLGKLANYIAANHLQGIPAANIIQVPPWLGITVIVATTVVGMLAGLYPAIRAARMNPVEALRYD